MKLAGLLSLSLQTSPPRKEASSQLPCRGRKHHRPTGHRTPMLSTSHSSRRPTTFAHLLPLAAAHHTMSPPQTDNLGSLATADEHTMSLLPTSNPRPPPTNPPSCLLAQHNNRAKNHSMWRNVRGTSAERLRNICGTSKEHPRNIQELLTSRLKDENAGSGL